MLSCSTFHVVFKHINFILKKLKIRVLTLRLGIPSHKLAQRPEGVLNGVKWIIKLNMDTSLSFIFYFSSTVAKLIRLTRKSRGQLSLTLQISLVGFLTYCLCCYVMCWFSLSRKLNQLLMKYRWCPGQLAYILTNSTRHPLPSTSTTLSIKAWIDEKKSPSVLASVGN